MSNNKNTRKNKKSEEYNCNARKRKCLFIIEKFEKMWLSHTHLSLKETAECGDDPRCQLSQARHPVC